jgi:glutamate transport system permease protein
MTSVLFDAPGPRTRARHRLYTILTAVAIVAAVVGFIAFLDSKGALSYNLWEPFVTPKFVRALLVDGLLRTLEMAFASVLFAIVFGTVFGVGKLSDHAWVRWVCLLVVEFFRAVPVLLLMIFVFFYWGITHDEFGRLGSVVIALTLYNGAVLAEVFRAGIQAVPKGQAEAAYAIGLRKTQVMTSILLPQAVKIMLPAIISQCVVAVKDTSLGMYVAAPGLTFVGKQIYNQFHNQLQTAIVLAAMYIIVNLLLTLAATWAQRRLVGEKKPLSVGTTAIVTAGDGTQSALA